MPTSTVENYLKAILVRSGDDDRPVSTGAMAEALDVTPGTITTMVKSLAAQGLVEHQPRGGVRLTRAGRAHALGVVRKHRVIETFLVQVLKMDWKEVHEEAEALEHSISNRVLERMDAILGHPDADPHGDPIPDAQASLLERGTGVTLASCAMQKAFRVERIIDQSAPFLEFIQRTGLKPGARVRVRERDRASGVVRCELGQGEASLGLPEAAKIEVKPADQRG
jgi:DtxR family Mn-dependent transcriptional regulator